MNEKHLKAVKDSLSASKNIAIVCHINPDGDALGSSLGLYTYLKLCNHKVTVITPNDYPSFLKWLPNENSILKFDIQQKDCITILNSADIIFTLDFNALHRTGEEMATVLEETNAVKIMIDHHQQPHNYATYLYSDVKMSSTCEMVYNFITMLGDKNKINQDIATCLYVGIMTDTGSFRFRSTTSNTHSVVSDLINKGADNTQIHNNVYDTNNFSRLQLLGRALENLKIIPNLRTAYTFLSQEDLDEFNFRKGDTEGFVNYALSIKNIVLAAIFIENKQDGIIKISLRSKGAFSVNQLSRMHFNGGGHTNAAGGKSYETLQATITTFESILTDYTNELTA